MAARPAGSRRGRRLGASRGRRLLPGGWAFQYQNAHYPDVDDTAVVGMLLHRHVLAGGDPDAARRGAAGARLDPRHAGRATAAGAPSTPTTTHHYLNHIPFADHGALLDPSTADVTARCVSFLAQIGMAADDPVHCPRAGVAAPEQETDGSWFGRWGTNYIYGTWSVLVAR